MRWLNTCNEYSSEWISETLSLWPEDSENKSEKNKFAADQTQDQGAAEVSPQGSEDSKNLSESEKDKFAAD